MSVEETLKERGNQYGVFKDHAYITQNIKNVMINSKNWATLSADKKEALEMIAHKIGRILNGNPEYQDSWHDIIGYAKLVEDTLIRKCIYPDSYYDWIPFTPTSTSECPVPGNTLVQIYTESNNFSTRVVAPAEEWYWDTRPSKKHRILAYRVAKDEADIQPFPKKTVFLDNDWVLFTATSNSKSPVPDDTLVQVLYDTNDDMNQIYKATDIDWTNNVSIPDRVYAYRIAKHGDDTKPAPKLVNPYR